MLAEALYQDVNYLWLWYSWIIIILILNLKISPPRFTWHSQLSCFRSLTCECVLPTRQIRPKPNLHFMPNSKYLTSGDKGSRGGGWGSRQIGPQTIGPRTVGPRTTGPRGPMSGAQFATFQGGQLGPNCPGPNLPLFQGGQLGPGQLGPKPLWYLRRYFWWFLATLCSLRWHFNVGMVYIVFLMLHLWLGWRSQT